MENTKGGNSMSYDFKILLMTIAYVYPPLLAGLLINIMIRTNLTPDDIQKLLFGMIFLLAVVPLFSIFLIPLIRKVFTYIRKRDRIRF